MALRAKVLQKKAEKFELKKLQAIKVTKEGVSSLDTLLQDVYVNRRPKQTDYEARKDLIRVFNEIAKELYGTSKDIPIVVEFGSFVMDLFSTASDLDLSVNFNTGGVDFPREKKIQTLRKFARKLYAIQSMGHVSGVLPITTAKVPILKCVDCGTGVECDISVENRDGISKSKIIWMISSIDERFKKLSFLMKNWAKAYNINSSKDKTLNSLSIILLVAFHLQTRTPPILPPFSAIFKDGTDPATVEKSIPNFLNYGKRNKESLAELFITLLLKLSSVEILWAKGLCASTCTASWTSKTWNSKVSCISVEDFTDISQNVARAVGPGEVKQIYKCIEISIQHLTSFMGGQIGLQLKDLLFGVDGIPFSIPRGIANFNMTTQFPHVQSHGKRIVTGKREKKSLRPFNKNSTAHMKRQSGKGKQVEQAVLVETSLAKRMRTDEGWADGNAAVGYEARGGGGWGVSEQNRWGGWGRGNQQQQSSWGWGAVQQGGGWGEGNQQSSGGWDKGAMQQGSGWGEGDQHGSQGWEGGIRQGGGWGDGNYVGRGWGGGGWERSEQGNVGGWGWGYQHGSNLC
ncbi:protein HESO1-like isoform X2 [Salvia hispanica]|uniref:protein HESO1-like isoform X2 n=1 Tax=Salvia hispanica TaxID=49212 RepID=UPI002008FEEE|nr:protein HESO1-like isoform X2 [Salvia hispanica]